MDLSYNSIMTVKVGADQSEIEQHTSPYDPTAQASMIELLSRSGGRVPVPEIAAWSLQSPRSAKPNAVEVISHADITPHYKVPVDDDEVAGLQYVLDSDDVNWCLSRAVPFQVFANIMTTLDRIYADFIVDQHMQHCIRSEGAEGLAEVALPDKIPSTNCDVCGELEYKGEEAARLVKCAVCGCHCHRTCWMIDPTTYIPSDGTWACNHCRVVRNQFAKTKCAICSVVGSGPFLPVEGRTPQWAHVVCALLLPEVQVTDKCTVKLGRFDKRRSHLKCSLCGDSTGICVQCYHPRCHAGMHPACAAQRHLVEIRRRADGQCHYHAFCPQHFAECAQFTIYDDLADEPEALRRDLSRESERVASTEVCEKLEQPVCKKLAPDIAKYWRGKRAARRESSQAIVECINHKTEEMNARILRSEIINLGGGKVALSQFLCFIPELQARVSTLLEGAVPQISPKVEVPAKSARTGGNTVALLRKMEEIAASMTTLQELSRLTVEREIAKRAAINLELDEMEAFLSGTSTKSVSSKKRQRSDS